jgi:branched-subunit amino acid aminotransferase/4-amino-4-deoxychorismate lyase
VFEGICAYPTSDGPAIFCLDAHLDRLGRGAEALGKAVDLAEMGNQKWTPGPVTQDLQAKYLDIVHGRTPARHDWLTWLPEQQHYPLMPSAWLDGEGQLGLLAGRSRSTPRSPAA